MSKPRFGSRLSYSRKRPSADQSIGNFGLGRREQQFLTSRRAVEEPPVEIHDARSPVTEPNTMLVPSGDQRGKMSSPGSNVIRSHARRRMSYDQMSMLPFANRYTATRRPSCESDGPRLARIGIDHLVGFPTGPIDPHELPLAAVRRRRSIGNRPRGRCGHRGCGSRRVSAIGNGSPFSSSRSRSKPCASSFPSRMKSRCPVAA